MNTIDKIVTHNGVFHADEILAIATWTLIRGVAPIERVSFVPDALMENPRVLVVDIGGVHSLKMMCFDHHQDPKLQASCVLILNYVFRKMPLVRNSMFKHFYSIVSQVDRGIMQPQPASFNYLIRTMNNLDDGFNRALALAKELVSASYITAIQAEKSVDLYNMTYRYNKVRVSLSKEIIMNWKSMAQEEGVDALICPGRTGGFNLISRDPAVLTIPPYEGQTFLANAGYMAEYKDMKSVMKHAKELNLL